MKLLHSRALLSASRNVRSCRGSRYISTPVRGLPHNPAHLHHRTLTTNATPTNTPTPTTNDSHQDDPSLSLQTQVRLLMRRVPYPVAIITSTDLTPSTTPSTESESKPDLTSQFRGMTVSSFNTVTLTPRPVISFNVRRPSETLHSLLSSGRFLVHLLAPNHHTASLARDFARGNHNLALGEGKFEFVGVAPSSVPSVSQSKVVDAKDSEKAEGEHGDLAPPLPLLRRKIPITTSESSSSPGPEPNFFPFIFECQLLPKSVAEVYDHTIVVGTIVRAITSNGSAETEISSKDLCLTYANTRFWGPGKEVV
ncbi:flavin reductase like domain-containing protein [Aspergillus aurantiobrunneus]